MVPGAFVRVLFPTHKKPRKPALLHVGYVLGCTAAEAMVAYTTSQHGQPTRRFWQARGSSMPRRRQD